jgi:hypothetical protein
MEPIRRSSVNTSALWEFAMSFPNLSCPFLAVAKEQPDKNGLNSESWERNSLVSRFTRSPFSDQLGRLKNKEEL